jgi:hypothetical protein
VRGRGLASLNSENGESPCTYTIFGPIDGPACICRQHRRNGFEGLSSLARGLLCRYNHIPPIVQYLISTELKIKSHIIHYCSAPEEIDIHSNQEIPVVP